MKYPVVCFDIDGTLYEPRQMRRNLFLCFLRKPVSMLKYSRMRSDFRRIQENLVINSNLDMLEREALVMLHRYDDLSCGDEDLENLRHDAFFLKTKKALSRIYEIMAEEMKNLKPRELAAHTFSQLREKGVKIGVFSDFPIGGKLNTLGLSSFVDFSADSIGCGYLKPDKRCFDYLLKCGKIDDYEAGTLLYVGDSYLKDYLGSIQCGWEAVLVGKEQEKAPEGTQGFSTWLDFEKWLLAALEE